MYYNTKPKSAPKGVTVMCFHAKLTLQKIMQSLPCTNSSKFLVTEIILKCKKINYLILCYDQYDYGCWFTKSLEICNGVPTCSPHS